MDARVKTSSAPVASCLFSSADSRDGYQLREKKEAPRSDTTPTHLPRLSTATAFVWLTLILIGVEGCVDPERARRTSQSFFKLLGISIKEHFERFCMMMGAIASLGWAIIILTVILAVVIYLVLRRSQVPNVSQLVKKKDVQGLKQALLYKRDVLKYSNRPQYEQYENNVAATIRAEAAFALGKFRSIDTVDCLIEALQDWNRDVRINAVRALIEIGDPRAIEPLLEIARCDPDEYARLSVQEALRAKGF